MFSFLGKSNLNVCLCRAGLSLCVLQETALETLKHSWRHGCLLRSVLWTSICREKTEQAGLLHGLSSSFRQHHGELWRGAMEQLCIPARISHWCVSSREGVWHWRRCFWAAEASPEETWWQGSPDSCRLLVNRPQQMGVSPSLVGDPRHAWVCFCTCHISFGKMLQQPHKNDSENQALEKPFGFVFFPASVHLLWTSNRTFHKYHPNCTGTCRVCKTNKQTKTRQDCRRIVCVL